MRYKGDMLRRIRPTFANGEIYHLFNRGVDKRDTFLDDRDYIRFVHNLYEFNDTAPAPQYSRRYVGSPTSNITNIERKKQRERLVDVLCWCLMPNHFHLMVRQRLEGGVSTFMRKLGTGYTNAFNQRNDRSGVLFQGKCKAEHVNNETYFLHLPFYIHANPVDLIEYGWKSAGIKDGDTVVDFLEKYRWSSFRDYVGMKNFPSLLDDQTFILQDRTSAQYKREMRQWLTRGDFSYVAGRVIDDE